MAKRLTAKGRLAAGVLLLALVWVAWTAMDRFVASVWTASAPSLENKVWLERLPRGERDIIGYLGFIEDDDIGRYGLSGRSSAWRTAYDGMRWRTEGDRMVLTFPQSRVTVGLRYQTSRCEGPGGLDHCLTLTDGNGRRVIFYSSDELVLPSEAQLPVTLPTLPTALATVDDSDFTPATLEALGFVEGEPR